MNKVILACSVFRYELDLLVARGEIAAEIQYIESMLHMDPQKLQKVLDEQISRHQDKEIVILFGDCHAKMLNYEKETNIKRVDGINCCDILLGTSKYRQLRKEGVFILLPEWAIRWKEVFVDHMGFSNQNLAEQFMKDMHTKIIYLDTGILPVDRNLLDDIANFTGLPVEIVKEDSSRLKQQILKVL